MAHIMSLKAAINHAQRDFSNVQLGALLGVTKDQVYKYGIGHTKTCRDNVVDAIYDNIFIAGGDEHTEPVLIDYYDTEEQYLKLRFVKAKLH